MKTTILIFTLLLLMMGCKLSCEHKYVITNKEYNTDGSLGWLYVYSVDKVGTHFKDSHYTNDEHQIGDTLCHIN